MWYNRSIPKLSLMKGVILMPKGKPNKKIYNELTIPLKLRKAQEERFNCNECLRIRRENN